MQRRPATRAPALVTLPTMAAACTVVCTLTAGTTFPASPASGSSPTSTACTDPAALVHPLDGTGTGPVSPGTVGEFPGADTPFGMIQWSPDTSPTPCSPVAATTMRTPRSTASA